MQNWTEVLFHCINQGREENWMAYCRERLKKQKPMLLMRSKKRFLAGEDPERPPVLADVYLDNSY